MDHDLHPLPWGSNVEDRVVEPCREPAVAASCRHQRPSPSDGHRYDVSLRFLCGFEAAILKVQQLRRVVAPRALGMGLDEKEEEKEEGEVCVCVCVCV